MPRGGYVGRILRVDLSREAVWYEPLPDDEVLRAFIGGKGLGLWYLYHFYKPGLSPFDPENPLIFMTGPLTGLSMVPSGNNTTAVSINADTGYTIGASHSHGYFGPYLKMAGFDGIIITGAAEKPVYLWIHDGKAEIRDADRFWGKDTHETEDLIKEDVGVKEASVAAIGPAGENLSAIAMIDANGRQAGRNGLGAVMGSKRLKAILVKGSKSPLPVSPSDARRIARELNKKTHEHQASKALVEYGTPRMLEYTNIALGVIPSLNWKRSTLSWCRDPKAAHDSLSKFAPRLRVSRNPCIGCGRPCSQVIEARGVRVDGPEYETVYGLGTDVGICDVEDVAYLNHLADELGFDTISVGATIAWAIHAGEEGILEGAPRWGDVEAIARLMEDMAYRRGELGSLLADGTKRAVEKLGRGGELAIHVKGMEPPAYDARGLKGMALGYAVSSRGADHLTSGAYAVEIPGRLWRFRDVDRLEYRGKGVLVKDLEDLMAFYDATGICKFSRATLLPENVAPLWSAVTGIEASPGDLLVAGERIVNLERLANLWMSLNPLRDDDLPDRLKKEPISDGPSKGEGVDEEKFKAMRSEYYVARGWSLEGVPTAATLTRLDLWDLLPEPIKRLPATRP